MKCPCCDAQRTTSRVSTLRRDQARYKCLVLGECVGKTALITRFIEEKVRIFFL